MVADTADVAGSRLRTAAFAQERHLPWIGAALAVMVFAAFTPTYFLPVAAGQFGRPSILHVHGALFFAWPVLFVVQAFLATRGRIQTHRSLGLLGIALATGMVFSGLAAIASTLHLAEQAAGPEQGNALALVAFSGVLMFAVFVTAAVGYRHRRDIHQRLMLLATLAMVQAASVRFVALIVLGGLPVQQEGAPPPLAVWLVAVPQLLVDAIVLVAVCLYDWRKRGSVHPAYVVGGSLLMLVQGFRHLIVDSDAWRGACAMLLALRVRNRLASQRPPITSGIVGQALHVGVASI